MKPVFNKASSKLNGFTIILNIMYIEENMPPSRISTTSVELGTQFLLAYIIQNVTKAINLGNINRNCTNTGKRRVEMFFVYISINVIWLSIFLVIRVAIA